MTTDEGHSLYEVLRDCLRRDEPIALVTVVASTEAAPLGAKLLVRRDGSVLGSLGNAELDAVVGRDGLGSVVSGQSMLRHYGPSGEARQEDVTVSWRPSALRLA